jgi:uridylate kinase
MNVDAIRPAFGRILLKLSGEALMGDAEYGISPEFIGRVACEIAAIHEMGVEIGIVTGGGNIFRGISGAAAGMDRASADSMGMLATVINSLALKDTLEQHGVPARVMSAVPVGNMAEPFVRDRAMSHLARKRVVIFAAGTGNPFFTTDTAAALRALEIKADVLFKGTKVDGIYSADPVQDSNAVKFDTLTYKDILRKGLRVMDAAAISLAQEAGLPVKVFNMQKDGNIKLAVMGEPVGTLVVQETDE